MAQSKISKSLGRVGVWSLELRFGDAGVSREASAELDELGFGAIWIPGGIGGDFFADMDRLLQVTRRATIASGIVNIWKHEPAEVGAWWRGLSQDHQSRVMLGLGVSHGPLIGEDYARPLTAMTKFLDGLDREGVPSERRCIAALGPKMLDLARDRSAGSHPYLATPEHTKLCRERMGPDALLAPEQGVIMETDPTRARDMARTALTPYMQLPNYVNNWRRLGFSEDDVKGSDRLCDALFAWGGVEKVKQRVDEHIAAGADHVCLQVVSGNPMSGDFKPPREAWRELAKALL